MRISTVGMKSHILDHTDALLGEGPERREEIHGASASKVKKKPPLSEPAVVQVAAAVSQGSHSVR